MKQPVRDTARREDGVSPAAPRFTAFDRDAADAHADAARVCRRCLLEQMDGERATLTLLRERLDALPSERRADDAAYRARLAVCALCDHLNGGVCALCGCYVEWRAALAVTRCADTPPRWTETAQRQSNDR